MSKKKVGIIVGVVVLVVAAAAAGGWYLLQNGVGAIANGDKVYVETVASLMNTSGNSQNRYSGVVEPQKSWDVRKDPEKTIKETFVKEGDQVEEGTPLFEYDTEEIQNQIANAKLELEGIDNEIADYYNQIETLTAERNSVSEGERFQYTTQIQTVQTSIKQSEYSKQSKQTEIERLEASLENAVVASEISGVIKSISESGYDQYTGEELPFMTVLAIGDYRVKGTVNEQNIWMIPIDSPVLIRSRIDENQTWTGTITEVDTNSEVNNNNNMYYDSGSAETATKYPFYIALDNVEGLILGQHVYIEMDMGQTKEKEGVWLYESYIVTDDDTGSYVWADNGKHRLERRTVELGEYDADLGMYQITSGLTVEDSVAFPMAAMYEGIPTVTDASEVDYSSPLYGEGGEGAEGDEMPEDDEDMDMEGAGGMEDGSDMLEGGEMLEGEDISEGSDISDSGEMLDSQITGPGVSE